eukprot:4080677-Amphidinium_carterae.1
MQLALVACRLPVCDTWVLGLARILGIPYRIGTFDKSNARGCSDGDPCSSPRSRRSYTVPT